MIRSHLSRCPQRRFYGAYRTRTGAVLLEAIVAMTILTTAGLACASYVLQASRTVEVARQADRAVVEAHTFLEAVALWPREELDQRLGIRTQGRWRLELHRSDALLYVVTLHDSTMSRALLRTTLYRPMTGDE